MLVRKHLDEPRCRIPNSPTSLRPIYLRLSITSKCNLRCQYCRPHVRTDAESEGRCVSGNDSKALTDQELVRLVSLISEVAPIYKLRLTGGEPLLRDHVSNLVRSFRRMLPEAELCMTTNGMRLKDRIEDLKAAGIESLNISLDTTKPDRFYTISRHRNLTRIIEGIETAHLAGFKKLKLNTVLMRKYNADHLSDLIRLAARNRCEIRFVELMPFGQGAHLFDEQFISADEALASIRSEFEYIAPLAASATARRHKIRVDGQEVKIGFITGMSELFCHRCDRIRLDSFGQAFSCLRSEQGVDLGALLRRNDFDTLRDTIRNAIAGKSLPQKHWPERSMVLLGG